MGPPNKKTKLTDHFRVALKPRDVNILTQAKGTRQQQPKQQVDEYTNKKQQPSTSSEQSTSSTQQSDFFSQQPSQSQSQSQSQPPAPAQLLPLKLKSLLQSKNLINISNNNSLLDVPKDRAVTSKELPTKRAATPSPYNKYCAPPGKHPNVVDHDKGLLNNVIFEPHYAWDSFDYERKQEVCFKSCKYLDLDHLPHEITPRQRAELVDLLVDIQTNYGLDHEPLYMAVKMADQYLMKKLVPNEQYLLLFLTSILVSAKFDERIPPITIHDLVQASRSKFGVRITRRQIISFEVELLSTLDFNIRFPLSYGFLRRFARCTRSDTKALNLARYILETSLMDYDMIDMLESEIAAGSLLLAFEMLHLKGAWNKTAEFYTGYNETELNPIIRKLNDTLKKLSRRNTAIKRKYSHESYMEVARIQPIFSSEKFR